MNLLFYEGLGLIEGRMLSISYVRSRNEVRLANDKYGAELHDPPHSAVDLYRDDIAVMIRQHAADDPQMTELLIDDVRQLALAQLPPTIHTRHMDLIVADGLSTVELVVGEAESLGITVETSPLVAFDV